MLQNVKAPNAARLSFCKGIRADIIRPEINLFEQNCINTQTCKAAAGPMALHCGYKES